jgi:predicted glutamine amidotransferase
MCRLFAALGSSLPQPSYFVHKAPQSLLHQSAADKKRLQGDGWGVGWFKEGVPQVRKSPAAMYDDRALVQRATRQMSGSALLGHVRWASNPLKLGKSELIGLAHTQPFVYQNWIFAHNGTLFIPKEAAAALPRQWSSLVQGRNDSEVLFYWLMQFLYPLLENNPSPSAEVVAAFVRESLESLDDVWKSCRASYPLHKHPYHGMNILLTNGETLISWSLVDPDGFGKAKALCNPKQPYYQLQRQVTKKSVIIASEPLDPKKKWEPFKHGELLIANLHGNTLKLEINRILPE